MVSYGIAVITFETVARRMCMLVTVCRQVHGHKCKPCRRWGGLVPRFMIQERIRHIRIKLYRPFTIKPLHGFPGNGYACAKQWLPSRFLSSQAVWKRGYNVGAALKTFINLEEFFSQMFCQAITPSVLYTYMCCQK